MEWFPYVFGTFKLVALGIGMFFAVKWHYDQSKKHPDRQHERRAVLGAAGKVVVLFALALVAVGLATFFLATKLGLDLSLP